MLRWALVAGLMIAAPAAAQPQVKYWPGREIGFPIPPNVLKDDPKPTKLRLYSAADRGEFKQVAERSANNLDPIENRPAGFQYAAKADGEEEFAVQLVYADGSVSPRAEQLKPEFRVVFDSRPPTVQVAASGQYGIEWAVADENLDTEALKLEYRWAGDGKWYEAKPRAAFKARDSFSWPSLAKETRQLEVRVLAKDKAGHETVSRVIRLPSTGGGNVGLPRDAGDAFPDRGPRAVPFDEPGPEIRYLSSNDFTVTSKLSSVTRSGVKAVHLFVKEYSERGGGEWKFAQTETCQIRYESPDPTVPIPYVAKKDGRYGFFVIPESGAGVRDKEPRAGAAPQHLIEVDTAKPSVKVTNVTVTPGTTGPRVEIEWDAKDPNLMPDPIILEYTDKADGGKWISIAEKIPNTRRYVWDVQDKSVWQIWVRASAVDKAGNSGTHLYEKAVNLDLDKPTATIEKVTPNGGGMNPATERGSDKPAFPGPVKPPAGFKAPDTLPSKL